MEERIELTRREPGWLAAGILRDDRPHVMFPHGSQAAVIQVRHDEITVPHLAPRAEVGSKSLVKRFEEMQHC